MYKILIFCHNNITRWFCLEKGRYRLCSEGRRLKVKQKMLSKTMLQQKMLLQNPHLHLQKQLPKRLLKKQQEVAVERSQVQQRLATNQPIQKLKAHEWWAFTFLLGKKKSKQKKTAIFLLR